MGAMTVWDSLSDVQADSVRATAARLLRDPEELAEDLAYLFAPRALPATAEMPALPPVPRLEPEAGWSLLGHTDEGFQLFARQVSVVGSAVNDYLTPHEQEPHAS